MPDPIHEPDISALLGLERGSGWRRRARRLLLAALAAVVALAAALGWWRLSTRAPTAQFTTEEARRGDLTVTVTATGNLEPVTTVQVGSELSGVIKSVEVDYNDPVKVGQVLARLNTDRLEAQFRQSRAAVESAQAAYRDAQATSAQTRADLTRLKHVWELSAGKVPSQREMAAAEADHERAVAKEHSTKALVSEAKAKLSQIETDLGKAVIRSPINGIVLNRQVEPGQTVAASLQAPVLFTLAENLAQMQVSVFVDEADVGQVQVGQPATFTVDAYPDRRFPARITMVRFASQTTEGVVTYATLLRVENPELLLRPGMTATADITVKTVKDGLLVPNAALRFSPPVAEAQPAKRESLLSNLFPRRPSSPPSGNHPMISRDGPQHQVWTLRDGVPVAVPVRVGLSDGRLTEVLAGEITPGLPVVVDTVRNGK